jgi:hypothetical protein
MALMEILVGPIASVLGQAATSAGLVTDHSYTISHRYFLVFQT